MFVRNGQKLGSVLVDREATGTEPEPTVEAPQSEPDSGADSVEPARYASKGDWVDYAVSQGASRDEAEASTKDALIAAYGTGEG